MQPRSDKAGKQTIVRTSHFAILMSDHYRSHLSVDAKQIQTDVSHHIIKAYCDAVHGLPFDIGTIDQGFNFSYLRNTVYQL